MRVREKPEVKRKFPPPQTSPRKVTPSLVRCRGCATPYTVDAENHTGWCENYTKRLAGLRKATRIERIGVR